MHINLLTYSLINKIRIIVQFHLKRNWHIISQTGTRARVLADPGGGMTRISGKAGGLFDKIK